MDVRVQAEVAPLVRIGTVRVSGVRAAAENPHWPEMDELAEALRAEHAGRAPAEIDGLAPARRLYRAFGIDPTRTRPSSEALLRRVLKEKELYRVNRLVDAVNWASLALLLPIGLYDLDHVQGDLEIRRGGPGESFEGIRRGEIHLEGRLVVADAAGACGSPTADSARTRVRPETVRAIGVVFAPADFPEAQLADGVRRLGERIVRWCGGRVDG